MLNQFNNGLCSLFSHLLENKPTEISITPPSIFLRLSKETLAKSKFFKKDNIKKNHMLKYWNLTLKNIIKIKNTFPKLPTKKVVKVNDIVNKSSLVKLKKKITIKRPSRKQVIILIDITTAKIIVNQANSIIIIINTGLKNLNFKTIADFIKLVNNRVVININQAALPQDMSVIIKTIKNTINVNLDSIENPYLSNYI